VQPSGGVQPAAVANDDTDKTTDKITDKTTLLRIGARGETLGIMVNKDMIFDIIWRAHARASHVKHRTFRELHPTYYNITKDLVSAFVHTCPVCAGKVMPGKPSVAKIRLHQEQAAGVAKNEKEAAKAKTRAEAEAKLALEVTVGPPTYEQFQGILQKSRHFNISKMDLKFGSDNRHPIIHFLRQHQKSGKGWIRELMPPGIRPTEKRMQLTQREKSVIVFMLSILSGLPDKWSVTKGWRALLADAWGVDAVLLRRVFEAFIVGDFMMVRKVRMDKGISVKEKRRLAHIATVVEDMEGVEATGLGEAGLGEVSPGEAGLREAGPGEASPGEAGLGDAGPGEAGSGTTGPGKPGPGKAGPGKASPKKAGNKKAGSLKKSPKSKPASAARPRKRARKGKSPAEEAPDMALLRATAPELFGGQPPPEGTPTIPCMPYGLPQAFPPAAPINPNLIPPMPIGLPQACPPVAPINPTSDYTFDI